MKDTTKPVNINILNFASRVLLMALAIWLIYTLIIPLTGVTHKAQSFTFTILALESFWFFIMAALLLLITARPIASVWLSMTLYVVFIAVSIVKIKFLDAPLMPIDFMQLDDLMRTTSVILEYLWISLLAVLSISWVFYLFLKKEKPQANMRWLAAAILFIFSVGITQFSDPIRLFLKGENLLIKKNTNLVVRFTRNGYLNFFMQALFLQTKPPIPNGYSNGYLKSITTKHKLATLGKSEPQHMPPDNIIIILAESFVDPNELGWVTSEPILKTFNELRAKHLSGHVVVPVYGGKSINSEFELLTGLTTFFTPIESLPSRELVSENTPSIAHVLKQIGFQTSVIQLVQLSGFGFEKIYDYLGFDYKYSLADQKGPMDPTGRYVSSKTLAMKIKSLTNKEKKSFIYAFANSSHMPWDLSDYPDNNLLLKDPKGLSKSEQEKLVAYFNALRHVEELLLELVEYYQVSDERTLILLAGDHHPSLPLLDKDDQNFREYKNYVVPFLIWQNYQSNEDSESQVFISMNFLSSWLLKVANIQTTGFFKFNAILMEQLKVVSAKFPFEKGLSDEQKTLLDEYEMMQYKILMD